MSSENNNFFDILQDQYQEHNSKEERAKSFGLKKKNTFNNRSSSEKKKEREKSLFKNGSKKEKKKKSSTESSSFSRSNSFQKEKKNSQEFDNLSGIKLVLHSGEDFTSGSSTARIRGNYTEEHGEVTSDSLQSTKSESKMNDSSKKGRRMDRNKSNTLRIRTPGRSFDDTSSFSDIVIAEELEFIESIDSRTKINEIEEMIVECRFDRSENEDTIVYIPGTTDIKATSFEMLIQKLTQETTDISMNSDFLLTYHDFKSPLELLLLLKKRLQELEGEKSPSLRVFNLIKQWLKNNFYDWTEEYETMELVIRDIRDISSQYQMKSYGDLLLNLHAKQQEKYFSVVLHDNDGWGTKEPPIPIVPNKYDSILSFNPLEVARQITLIESVLFRNIKPYEIFSKGWMAKDKSLKAPGITIFIQHFNRMTFWVSTEVLKKDTSKGRAEVVVFFLEVAQHCRELSNFNGLFEIFSGIDSAPLSRLKGTWDLISDEHKEQMERYRTLFDRRTNYAEFRHALKLILPPCIPYIGVFLSDITMISDGGKNEINGLINFIKRRQVAHVLEEVIHLQKTSYCLLYITKLRGLILSVEVWDENTQYDMASFREPRQGKDPVRPIPVLTPPISLHSMPHILSSPEPNPPGYTVKDPKKKKVKKK